MFWDDVLFRKSKFSDMFLNLFLDVEFVIVMKLFMLLRLFQSAVHC